MLDLPQNVEAYLEQESPSSSRFWNGLFFPMAEAFPLIVGVIGAIIAALASSFLGKGARSLLASAKAGSVEEISNLSEDQKLLYDLMKRIGNGGYDKDSDPGKAITQEMVQKLANGESITPPATMCSSGTYLLELAFMAAKTKSQTLPEELSPSGQRDGVGPWGYWNANGPGMAAYI